MVDRDALPRSHWIRRAPRSLFETWAAIRDLVSSRLDSKGNDDLGQFSNKTFFADEELPHAEALLDRVGDEFIATQNGPVFFDGAKTWAVRLGLTDEDMQPFTCAESYHHLAFRLCGFSHSTFYHIYDSLLSTIDPSWRERTEKTLRDFADLHQTSGEEPLAGDKMLELMKRTLSERFPTSHDRSRFLERCRDRALVLLPKDVNLLYTHLVQEFCRAISHRRVTGYSERGDDVDLTEAEISKGQSSLNTSNEMYDKLRPAYMRDHLWRDWKMDDDLGPAAIRDRWDSMSDDDRKACCPKCWEKIGEGSKDAGRDVVKKALKKAEQERGS